MTSISKTQIQLMETALHSALFPMSYENEKIMCATFPSRGTFVLSGVIREFNRHNEEYLDMTDYFYDMSLGDYNSFLATIGILS